MDGAGEDDAAPPASPPPPPHHQPVDEEATAASRKLSRLEHHGSVGDEPSFRMENLPEEIQPIVISLLPLKDAVRTSIVARSWRMLWTFYSNLCFYGPNDQDYDSEEYDAVTDKESIHNFIKIKRAKFIEDVNWVVERHSGIGINTFSVRCGLHKEDFDHLDRWIGFAASSKAKVIEFDLKLLCHRPSEEVHHFPLEVLDVQGGSFVQSLLLANVSVKPHSGIRGFTILRRLALQYVQIIGDFSGFLANCSALEELEIIRSGVTSLSIPHKLDKLKHLLIKEMNVKMVEFHAVDLAHFVYKGRRIPIFLHGCSKLEKATMTFQGTKGLGRVFTLVPSILPVKILNVQADIYGYEQLQKLTTRPHGMFTRLRHMTCQLIVRCSSELPKADNGVLQLAHCLNVAPQLETLHLDMLYIYEKSLRNDEVVEEEERSPMHRHDHLKTVYISGFRLYRAQKKLVCCILENAPLLEQMQLEARCVDGMRNLAYIVNFGFEKKFVPQVREWARLTSLRFGKVVTAVDAPSE